MTFFWKCTQRFVVISICFKKHFDLVMSRYDGRKKCREDAMVDVSRIHFACSMVMVHLLLLGLLINMIKIVVDSIM